MAHAGPNTNSSQFYIVQSPDVGPLRSEFARLLETQDDIWQNLPDGSTLTYGNAFPAEACQHFLAHGGTPSLDVHFTHAPHTVFGHVVTGMDVVDAIVDVPRDASDRPHDDVIIESFTFFLYEGGQ